MDLDYLGFVYRRSARRFAPQNMNYLILVPTLRCNLACSYCQVSRENGGAKLVHVSGGMVLLRAA